MKFTFHGFRTAGRKARGDREGSRQGGQERRRGARQARPQPGKQADRVKGKDRSEFCFDARYNGRRGMPRNGGKTDRNEGVKAI